MPATKWIGLAGASLSILALGLVSCATSPDVLNFFPSNGSDARLVGNEVCSECHLQQSEWFGQSPHGKMPAHSIQSSTSTSTSISTGEATETLLEVSCESCHGAGSLHALASGAPSKKTIRNPGATPEICFTCHLDIQNQMSLPYHHRVNEGRLNCVDCHDPHGKDPFHASHTRLKLDRDDSCAQCHQEQTQNFAFEHEALREGCVTCHSPHGSIHPKMLTERDTNLCLKCHAQMQLNDGDLKIGAVSHRFYLTQGTCWSAGCHTAVHGSNINSRLLY